MARALCDVCCAAGVHVAELLGPSDYRSTQPVLWARRMFAFLCLEWRWHPEDVAAVMHRTPQSIRKMAEVMRHAIQLGPGRDILDCTITAAELNSRERDRLRRGRVRPMAAELAAKHRSAWAEIAERCRVAVKAAKGTGPRGRPSKRMRQPPACDPVPETNASRRPSQAANDDPYVADLSRVVTAAADD